MKVTYLHPKLGRQPGEIVRFIFKGERLSEQEMKQYTRLCPGDLHFEELRGPWTTLRVVIRREDGHFSIGSPTAMEVKNAESGGSK